MNFDIVYTSHGFTAVPDPLKGTKGTGLRPRAPGGLAPQGALTGLLRFLEEGKGKTEKEKREKRKEKERKWRKNGEKTSSFEQRCVQKNF